jgi:UDP-3-O-[3-hydroxymyristoyl] glucosamine N-acyltransferase
MFTLDDIAKALGRDAEGDAGRSFLRAAEPAQAGPDDLALAMSPSYADALRNGAARVAILWEGADWRALGLDGAVTVPRARLAMARITTALDPGPGWPEGIHPASHVDPSARLADDVSVGAFAVVGPRARIGRGSRVGAGAVVGPSATLGEDVTLHPRVVIGHRVELGDRVICQPGASIGGDGFSFVTEHESGVERARRSLGDRGEIVDEPWQRIHSLGAVQIGNDVEIGANSTVDRGTVADTMIGPGTKIDNLVMVGHNVRVGRDCLLCALVGVAGGVRIGDRVVLAGQVGVNDNITIGDDVVAGGASKIFTSVKAGQVILGYPAARMETHLREIKAIRRLPRLAGQVAELRKTVADLVEQMRHRGDARGGADHEGSDDRR